MRGIKQREIEKYKMIVEADISKEERCSHVGTCKIHRKQKMMLDVSGIMKRSNRGSRQVSEVRK